MGRRQRSRASHGDQDDKRLYRVGALHVFEYLEIWIESREQNTIELDN